jgi:uncharacterized protein YndB with AHSA1/START domain
VGFSVRLTPERNHFLLSGITSKRRIEMVDKTQTLTFTQEVKAPVEQLYFAVTNQPVLQTWLCNVAEIEAREKGRFFVWWNEGYYASGMFTKVEENKGVSFTWHGLGEPAPTKVDITLKKKDGGTLVTLKHSEIGTDKAWEDTVKAFKEEWAKALTNLQFVMEKGIDKRLYDQPLLGVYPAGVLNEKEAKRLGVPVDKGAWINATVEGSGAEAAGLQADDVIHEIAGTVIETGFSFAQAVKPYKAGDEVEMVIYRGSEKKTLPVKLSRRPFPEVPATAKELAKEVEKSYQQLDKDLEAIFKGVSEEEASKRPAPEEWSAKETLAHLLYTERWAFVLISTSVGGQRGPGFFNHLEQLKALADSYPKVADIIAEIKRNEKLTVATLAALPDEFVARKVSYVGLANTLLPLAGLPQHTRSHFPQMQAAIKVAREG